MYKFKEVTLKNGPKEKKVLVIHFDDAEMEIVGEFLMADARLLRGQVLQKMELVLAGEKDVMESSGNRCSLTIKADVTKITDLFEGMDGVDWYPSYEINTRKLRELIVMWLEKLDAFHT